MSAAQDLADRILTFLDENGCVSFVEIIREVPGVDARSSGEEEFDLRLTPHCVLWPGLTATGCAAFDLARETGDDPLVLIPTAVSFYVEDGAVPRLPIAATVRAYATDHWLPVGLMRRSYAEFFGYLRRPLPSPTR